VNLFSSVTSSLAVRCGKLQAACSSTFLLIYGAYCYALLISSMNIDVIYEFL